MIALPLPNPILKLINNPIFRLAKPIFASQARRKDVTTSSRYFNIVLLIVGETPTKKTFSNTIVAFGKSCQLPKCV